MSGKDTKDSRPDPDALLRTLETSEQKSEGRLKIFFGACPGVGKTFTMLEAARRELSSGKAVMVGYVEPHQRPETTALLDGLPTISPLTISHKGVTLKELDVQNAIALKPDILLVDELAHSNASGSLNEKRWQDIQQILAAGIDVFTTLNVQHLESTKDLVAQVTGVQVREMVPDVVFDGAWEVELVDLTPDELLQRLRSGRIYLAEQAKLAEESFFRRGNLVALRELALRRTAERVDRQLEEFRKAQAIPSIWPIRDKLLVCVGPSPLSGRLVRATRRMAASLKCSWIAVHLDALGRPGISSNGRDRTLKNLRLAERLGAETAVLTVSDMVNDLLTFSRERNITKIIVGKPSQPRWREYLFGSFVYTLTRRCGEIDIYILSGDPGEDQAPLSAQKSSPLQLSEYLWSIAAMAIATALSFLIWSRVEPINLVMIYLIGVIFVASKTSAGPSVLAAFLAVAIFDLVFVPPYWTFAVSDTEYFFTFAAMLVTALIISSLTLRLRAQGVALQQREQRTSRLFTFSRRLLSAAGEEEALELSIRTIGETLGAEVGILLKSGHVLSSQPVAGSQFSIDEGARGVADWAFRNNQPAGRGTSTLSASQFTFYPIASQSNVHGVLGIRQSQASELWDSDRSLILDSFLDTLGSHLERAALSKLANEAKIEAEAERLRNTLLSAVSHDLRTPLAVIEGASSTLLDEKANLEDSTKDALLQTIVGETEYLHRMIGNLLDASRLEAGQVRLNREWQSLEELIGAVLHRSRHLLSGRPLEVHLPRDLPFISSDGVLLSQVFMNLLENAAKFSPSDSPIRIEGRLLGKEVEISVQDHGRGIDPSEISRVFERFFRGRTDQPRNGSGLGLAVSEAIVKLHNGKIVAENAKDGGAIFRVFLPCGDTPPEPPPEESELVAEE